MIVCCFKCGLTPNQMSEYQEGNFWEKGEYLSAVDYVMKEEGTFNKRTKTFACTDCYIAIGCPVGVKGGRWIAPSRVEKI